MYHARGGGRTCPFREWLTRLIVAWLVGVVAWLENVYICRLAGSDVSPGWFLVSPGCLSPS